MHYTSGMVVFAVVAAGWMLLAVPTTTHADRGNCITEERDGTPACRPPRGLSTCNTQDNTGGSCVLRSGGCNCEGDTPRPENSCMVGFTFPSSQVEPGSSLTGFLDVNCPGAFPNGTADLHVGILTPGGDFVFLGSNGSAFGASFQTTPSPVHIMRTAGVNSWRVPLPVIPVPNNVRQGRYTFFSAVGEPTTDPTELFSSSLNWLSPIASSDVIIQFFRPADN